MKFEHRVYFQEHGQRVQEPIVTREVPFVPRKSDVVIISGLNYQVLEIEVEYGPVSHYELDLHVIITIHLERTMK